MTLWSSPFSQFHQLKACEYDNVKGRKVTILRGQDPPEVFFQILKITDFVLKSVKSTFINI